MYARRKKRYNEVKNKTKVVSKLVSFPFFKKSKSPESLMAQGFIRHSQVVRQRSAKPLSPSSNLGGASRKKHLRKQVLFLTKSADGGRNPTCVG